MKKLFVLPALLLTLTGNAFALSAQATAEILSFNVTYEGEYMTFDAFPNSDVSEYAHESEPGLVDIAGRKSKASADGEWDWQYAFYRAGGDPWIYAFADTPVKMNLKMDYRLTAKTETDGINALAFSGVVLGYNRVYADKDGNGYWQSGEYEAAYLDGFSLLNTSWSAEYKGTFEYTVTYLPGQWGSWFLNADSVAWTDGVIIIPEGGWGDDCSTPVPEPLSVVLFGMGIVGLLRGKK
jgi:hypothetical protein